MNILVVIDMQNDFIDGALANPAAKKIVEPLAEYIKNFDGLVIFTRDTHNENYLNTQEGKNLPVVHCIQGTWGWQINEDLEKAAESVKVFARINKDYFNGAEGINNYITFAQNVYSYGLQYKVDTNMDGEITEIEFAGTVTEICVVSTVLGLKPYLPEIPFSVHRNLCAGLTEEGHEAALKVMEACQITIVD